MALKDTLNDPHLHCAMAFGSKNTAGQLMLRGLPEGSNTTVAVRRVLAVLFPPNSGASACFIEQDGGRVGDGEFCILEKMRGIDADEFFHDAESFFLVEERRGIDAGAFFPDAGEAFLVEKLGGMAFIRR